MSEAIGANSFHSRSEAYPLRGQKSLATIVLLVVFASCLSGCSFFSPPSNLVVKPAPIEVSPWRVMDRASPGKPGGTLHVSELGSGPKTFNPIIANEQSSNDILTEIFSSLLDFNFKTNKVIGGLAYRWESSKDGKEWTVYLRKGLYWSDGVPLTADDVLFTFQAIYDPRVDNPSRDIAQVQGKPIQCKKINDNTIRFILPGIYGPFPFLLNSISIVPKHKLEKALKEGTFSSAYGVNTLPQELVSLGAYRLREYVPGQRVVLERNPYFYAKDVLGERLPYLDRIIVNYVPDMDTQFLKFKTGELDVMAEFSSKFYDDLKSAEKTENYRVMDLGPQAATSFIVFNENPNPKFLDPVKYKWFSNKLFRQAIAYAVDRESMIRLAHLGHGYVVSQDFHPTSRFYNRNVKPFPYDIKKARALLQEAGFTWKDRKLLDDAGHPVEFTLLSNTGNVERRIKGELFKEDLKQLGIKVDFHPIDFNQLVGKLDHSFDWEAVLIGLVDTGGSLEPSNDQNVWLSSGFTHEWYPRQKKPATSWEAELDRLVNQGIGVLDLEKRKKIYGRIEGILYQEEVPMILTTVSADLYAFRNTIGNANPTPIGRFWSNCSDTMLMAQVYMKVQKP